MKIAQIAPLIESVPPKKYGGTERVVWELTEELVKRGHEVTLFATGDSITKATLSSVYPVSLRNAFPDDHVNRALYSHLHLAEAYSRQAEFDIIHDHTGSFGCALAQNSSTPTVMTLHGSLDMHSRILFGRLTRPFYVTISRGQKKSAPELQAAETVHNGLDFSDYPMGLIPGSYLLYVGRIHPLKGAHVAIRIASEMNLPLVIAAKYEPQNSACRKYFKTYIEPKLSTSIRFIGEITPEKRNLLMAGALASLHTATWEEPFGLTIIESAACGCPVIALKRGAIPEIIADGINGYAVDTVEDIPKKVKKISRLNRLTCATYTRSVFSASRMAAEYENIYANIHRLNRYVAERHIDKNLDVVTGLINGILPQEENIN